MCGILFLYGKSLTTEPIIEKFKAAIQKRGPGAVNCHSFEYNGVPIIIIASVLHMQGDYISEQPLFKEDQGI